MSTPVYTLMTTSDDLSLTTPENYNPVLAYLNGLHSARSQVVLRDDLATIAAMLLGVAPASVSPAERRAMVFDVEWHTLQVTHLLSVRDALVRAKYSHHSINRMLCAARGVLKACWRGNLMTGEAYYKARDVAPVTGSTLPAGRDLSTGERRDLFAVCSDDNKPKGARDAALLACADAGLRRAEIASLTLVNYEAEKTRLFVHGKGNKERYVPLEDGQTRAIEDWLIVRGDAPGALLWPVSKSGKLTNRHLTSQAVYNVTRKRGAEAGVTDFSPHDFRRTLVGDLLDAGADLSTVQKIMGHASPTTTARYDRRPESAKQKAANLRHTPYKSRAV